MKCRPLHHGHRWSSVGAVAALLSVVCASGRAWAFDEAARAEVLSQYQQATADYNAQRYSDSAVGFARALNTIPLPVLALWTARANVQCRDLLAAMAAYARAAQLTSNELWVGVKQQRAQVEAADELKQLSERVPRIIVKVPLVAASDTKVTIDGGVVVPIEHETGFFVNPGTHVVAYAHGDMSTERRFSIVERQVQILEFGVDTLNGSVSVSIDSEPRGADARVGGPGRGETGTPEPGVSAPVRTQRRYLAMTVASTAIGAAGLVAGIVTRLLVLDQKHVIDSQCDATRECTQAGMDAVSKAGSYQTQSTIYGLVGIAGIGTGIGLAIAGTPKLATQARLDPLVLPDGAGVTFERRF